MTRPTLALALLATFLFAPAAHAWSFKEHILVTRMAVGRLLADPGTPEGLKTFLRANASTADDAKSNEDFLVHGSVGAAPTDLKGLDYWCVFPDIARQVDGNKPVAPFGVPEALMHFIDLELLKPGEDVHQYRDDLSGKPTLADFPKDYRDPRLVQAGFLPYRVEQIYGQLVTAFRDNKLEPAGEGDRDNALVLGGYLCHYLADNTQPQHSTIDYKSLAYFDNARKAPNVHGMMEYGMLDWEGHDFPALRQELWAAISADLARMDDARQHASVARFRPFADVAAMSLFSYDALPLIGRAAQAAAGQRVQNGDPAQPVGPTARTPDDFDMAAFFHTRGLVGGQDMSLLDVKARQLAIAVTRVQAALLQAWDDAQKPATAE